MRTLTLIVGMALWGSATAQAACRPEGEFVVRRGETSLVATIEGRGRPVILIPSLGRGPQDFTRLAGDLAAAGFAVIRYQPRWFGASDGPPATLDDLAEDAAAVATAACGTERFAVLGHAFGNRVARAVVRLHPFGVTSAMLLAAGGQVPIPPAITRAVAMSAAQGAASDTDRLAALRIAFFAPGHDPAVWLDGWSQRAATLQSHAAGSPALTGVVLAPDFQLLVVQALLDPVAPPANAAALRTDVPERVTIVDLANARHAILPEQPKAVSATLIAWLRGERSETVLQELVDRATVP